MRFITDVTWDTAKLLKKIYKHSEHYQVRHRAYSILLSYKDKNIPELMEIYQVSINHIYKWMNNWESQRLLGLYNCKVRERNSTFTPAQNQRIKEWLNISSAWNKVLEEIEKEGKIKVSKNTIKRLFKIMFMCLQKCQILNQFLWYKSQKIQQKISTWQEKNVEKIGLLSYFHQINCIKILKGFIKYEWIKIYAYSR